MKTAEKRKKIISKVNEADDRLLNVLEAVVESYTRSEVVAFSVTGEPLTNYEYNQELLEAEKEVSEGKTISTEDLEQQSKNW